MAYTLQAFIGDVSTLTDVLGVLPSLRLPQNKLLNPLTSSVRAAAGGIPFLPFTDEGSTAVPEALSTLSETLSLNGIVAYVEAEIFGGSGAQAMFVAERGRLLLGPIVADHAINAALRAIGVVNDGSTDEFEALHLGNHRDTEDWLPT